MKGNLIRLKTIAKEIYDMEHPDAQQDTYYGMRLEEGMKDIQKKRFNYILKNLKIYNDLSEKLRENGRISPYAFPVESESFIRKILSKSCMKKFKKLFGKKGNVFETEEIIEIVRGFWDLYVYAGYSEDFIQTSFEDGLTILGYEDCKKKILSLYSSLI